MELTGLMAIEFRRAQTLSAMVGASYRGGAAFWRNKAVGESSIVTKPMRRSGAQSVKKSRIEALDCERDDRHSADTQHEHHQRQRIVIEPLPTLYTHDAPHLRNELGAAIVVPGREQAVGMASPRLLVAGIAQQVQKLAQSPGPAGRCLILRLTIAV
jgi:hypothetical protein